MVWAFSFDFISMLKICRVRPAVESKSTMSVLTLALDNAIYRCIEAERELINWISKNFRLRKFAAKNI